MHIVLIAIVVIVIAVYILNSQNGGREQAMVGSGRNRTTNLAVQFTGLTFVPDENKLLYFIRDEAFGGLFEHDIDSGKELRARASPEP